MELSVRKLFILFHPALFPIPSLNFSKVIWAPGEGFEFLSIGRPLGRLSVSGVLVAGFEL